MAKTKPQAQKGDVAPPHSMSISYLSVYRFMRAVGFLAVFVTALVHILVLINVREPESVGDVAEVISVVLFLISAAILLLAVCEAKVLKSSFGFLMNWIGLGLSLFYLAIVTLSILSSNAVNLEDPWPLILQIVCWTLAGIGLILFLLGLCGGKKMKDRDEAIADGTPVSKV